MLFIHCNVSLAEINIKLISFHKITIKDICVQSYLLKITIYETHFYLIIS